MDAPKILVLEDDEQLRQVLATVLQAEGFIVRVAPRAEEALRLAHEDPPDLVVADIRMEGMDGLEALELMRERNPGMRSLVVTGYSTEADSIRAIRLGVGDYLKKPFNLSEFLESIQRILAARHEEQARAEREASLRRTVLWALKTLVEAWAQTRPSLRLVESRCQTLVDRLGYSVDVREGTLLACYYSLTREIGGAAQASAFTASLPTNLLQHFLGLDEHWDGSGPLEMKAEQISREARVAAVVLAGLEAELPEDSLAQHLEASQPGRYDPEVLAALARGGHPATLDASAGAQRRGLLSLGRALEESRQSDLAGQTYRRLCQASSTSREAVEAFCGLGRLAYRAGQRDGLLENYKRALHSAEGLGPAIAATTALEAAFTLASLGDPQAAAWAERAAMWYRHLNHLGGQALAELINLFCGADPPDRLASACTVLGNPEHANLLTRQASWLSGLFLQRPRWLDAPEARRVALRLFREQGSWMALWWKSERATPELRRELSLRFSQNAMVEHLPALYEAMAVDPDEVIRGLVTGSAEPAPSPASLLGLRVHSMGNFEVYKGQEKIPESAWKTQKVKYLLALLASRRGRPVSEDVLIEHFWPGEADRGKQNLYWATSVIRRNLRGFPCDPIERVHFSLQLNPQIQRWHDFDLLDDGLAEAREGLRTPSSKVDVALLRRNLELYRGPYLEGCYYDWAEGIRVRLARTATEVYESASDRLLQENRASDALELAHFLLEIDNCNQNAQMLVMKGLLQVGKAEDCLRHYDNCKRALQRELGIEPSIALFECYQRARLLC